MKAKGHPFEEGLLTPHGLTIAAIAMAAYGLFRGQLWLLPIAGAFVIAGLYKAVVFPRSLPEAHWVHRVMWSAANLLALASGALAATALVSYASSGGANWFELVMGFCILLAFAIPSIGAFVYSAFSASAAYRLWRHTLTPRAKEEITLW